ncbi:hypothetical protein R6Q59_021665 [Mikania micrantha]
MGPIEGFGIFLSGKSIRLFVLVFVVQISKLKLSILYLIIYRLIQIIIIKEVIAIAGVIRDLVDLILKWSRGGDRVLKGVVGALTNLAADDKCSMEIAAVGGTSALVTLACKCKHEGVQRRPTHWLI